MRTDKEASATYKLSAEHQFLLKLTQNAQCVLQLGASRSSTVGMLASLSQEKEVALVEPHTPRAKRIKLALPRIRVSNSPIWKILDTYRPVGRAAVISTLTPSRWSAKKRKYFLDSLQLLLQDVPNCVLFQTAFGFSAPYPAPEGLEWASLGWTHRFGVPRRVWSLSALPKPVAAPSGFSVSSLLSETQFQESHLA